MCMNYNVEPNMTFCSAVDSLFALLCISIMKLIAF